MAGRNVYLLTEINDCSIRNIIEEIENLLEQDPEKEIILNVDSGGGAGETAIFFYNWVKSENIPLTTVARGVIASAAITVFLSGRKRKATVNSYFLIHPDGRKLAEKIKELMLAIFWRRKRRENVALAHSIKNIRLCIYREETKLTPAQMEKGLFKDYLMLTCKEAMKAGIVNEIID